VNADAATILIVDDEPRNCSLLEALLQPQGYRTRTAASGEEALASVAREPPDLILLDVMMPGMNGFEVARVLKTDAATAHIPIIIVTASVSREARLAGLDSGVEDFLGKPVDRGELWLRVRNMLRLKAYGDLLKNQGSILEQQVQERTADLQRFRTGMDATEDAIYMVDRASMSFVHVNDAACRMWNQTEEDLLALGPADLLGVPRSTLEGTYDALIASGVNGPPVEMDRLRRDGSRVWLELRRHAQNFAGQWTIFALVRDITERKENESKLRRLNRVYAVLSAINMLIVRVRDRDELFREACRIAVEEGGFRMGWIGVLDRESRAIVPIASAGIPASQFAGIVAFYAVGGDAQVAGSKATQAMESKQPVISNDFALDFPEAFARRHDEAGIHSVAFLPLVVADESVAVLTLYAAERDYFNSAELKLLNELAGDIAFAIDNIDKQARVDYLAYYDVLTGLANRRLFLERVSQYMRSAVTGGHRLAVFLVDLEHFKNINDSLGQLAGDALLRQVADWLTRRTGDASVLARLGADHFAVVLPEVKREGGVTRLLESMIAGFLDHPFRLDEAIFRIAARVGVAVFPSDGEDADTLLKNAEAALKKAKADRERYLFYTQAMTRSVAGNLTLENQLRQALGNGEFVLHYQPKVNLASGRLASAEALIRWNDPRTGQVPPGRFIPILEETGLIYDVGRWALRQALRDYLQWRRAGLPAVRVAVNVSPLQLRNRGFVAEIEQVLGEDSAAPAGLELEITESLIVEDVKHSILSLTAIRALGVTVAIDDFGTGFSSLSYLARLPVDTLKIDGSFVTGMTAGPEGLALVSTIINLAHALRLNVVAEGVETEEQSRLLRLLKCDEMQGFVYSKPVPAADFEARFLALPALQPATAT